MLQKDHSCHHVTCLYTLLLGSQLKQVRRSIRFLRCLIPEHGNVQLVDTSENLRLKIHRQPSVVSEAGQHVAMDNDGGRVSYYYAVTNRHRHEMGTRYSAAMTEVNLE